MENKKPESVELLLWHTRGWVCVYQGAQKVNSTLETEASPGALGCIDNRLIGQTINYWQNVARPTFLKMRPTWFQQV